jgi:hypothetical protein
MASCSKKAWNLAQKMVIAKARQGEHNNPEGYAVSLAPLPTSSPT